MNILIYSFVGDTHPHYVTWALRQLGHQVETCSVAGLSAHLRSSQRIGAAGGASFHVRNQDEGVVTSEPDVVWVRRIGSYAAIADDIHPSDREVALREAQRFADGAVSWFDDTAFCVNPGRVRRHANSKAIQLKVARTCGLDIPETLISNDPDAIRDFWNDHNKHIIYKPFLQAAWTDGENTMNIYTSILPEHLMSNDKALSSTPGIYQPYIDKAYELRVVFMGDTCITARLDTQVDSRLSRDWRSGNQYKFKVSPDTLPENIREKCKNFMESIGIVFGSFDFIVTPGGDHIMLEVNEQGQFLWLEDRCTDIPMLDAFSRFLISQDKNFVYKPSDQQFTMADCARVNDVKIALHRSRTQNPDGRAYGIAVGKI